MIRFRALRPAVALSALFLVAACQEDEQACYDRISADFKEAAEVASKSGNHAYAVTALESDLAALVILTDDDRSACDYVTAGPYLQRK